MAGIKLKRYLGLSFFETLQKQQSFLQQRRSRRVSNLVRFFIWTTMYSPLRLDIVIMSLSQFFFKLVIKKSSIVQDIIIIHMWPMYMEINFEVCVRGLLTQIRNFCIYGKIKNSPLILNTTMNHYWNLQTCFQLIFPHSLATQNQHVRYLVTKPLSISQLLLVQYVRSGGPSLVKHI